VFVIQRADGWLVSLPGSRSSYTRTLERARVFPTREAADAERCPENETVREIRVEFGLRKLGRVVVR